MFEPKYVGNSLITQIDPRWSHEGLQVLPILWEIMANWICFDSQAIVSLNLYMKPCSEDSFRHFVTSSVYALTTYLTIVSLSLFR